MWSCVYQANEATTVITPTPKFWTIAIKSKLSINKGEEIEIPGERYF